MKKRLTVAHYNENLNWLNYIYKNIDIYIYHKNDNKINYNEKIILENEENITNFELRNVGRESHTYLKHIIDNYDNLYDIEYFAQGSIVEYPTFIDIINRDENIEYRQYSIFHRTFDSFNGKITHHMCNPDHIRDFVYPDTIDIWKNLFDYNPPYHTTIIPHAFIKIDKKRILMHKKEVYEKCLEYFSDNNKDNLYAWSFEYFWALLFNDIHLIK